MSSFIKDGVFLEFGSRIVTEAFEATLGVPMKKAGVYRSRDGFRLDLDGAFAPCITAYGTGRVSAGSTEDEILAEVRRVARELAIFVNGTRCQHDVSTGRAWLAHKIGVLSAAELISTDGAFCRQAEDASDAWDFTIRFFYGLFEWRVAEAEGIHLPSHASSPVAAEDITA